MARHVIVGAGPAGLAAVETLRALDRSARIALVCDEPPYARMALPYHLEGRIEERGLETGDAAWFESLGVETRLGRRASGLDPKARRLLFDDGTSLDYERLLVATGSRVAVPEIEGADAPGVIPMWTLEHARRFLARGRGETAIIGAGFIAFTVLDALCARSSAVAFVELEPRVLPRMLDAQGSAAVERRLQERRIEVRTGARVRRIETRGARLAIHVDGGSPVLADSVVLATGVRPNVDFLAGSGIAIEQGILVDAHLRTSLPDVFAAGDVAQGPDLLGGPRRVQAIQPTAVDHGRIAAANMAGTPVSYAGSLTMNVVAAQGLEAASFGRFEGEREALRVENPANGIYRKYVFERDVVVGGILVGPSAAVTGANDVGMLKGLIQTGVPLGPWKEYLHENPLDLRRVYVASGAAKRLIGSTLLAGRATAPGGFRFPAVAPARRRSPHHGAFVSGAPEPKPA
jgi:NADPH-dependent 2,4-dienoyl-CoA reductase/sulfur reductase-like enzyme